MSIKFKIPDKLRYIKCNKKFGSRKKRIEGKVCFLSKNFSFGLYSLETGFVSTKQMSTAFSSIMKIIKENSIKLRLDFIKCSIYPRMPVTKRPVGVRMGKGKGKVDFWGFLVKRNRLIFELSIAVDNDLALRGLRSAKIRLPILTKVISRFRNK